MTVGTDLTENPKGLGIRELEAAQLVHSLEDTAIAVINGNYAAQSMGASATQAVLKVLLPEALPSLVLGSASPSSAW
ncbi:MAG: hypothetical protein KF885_11635 [Anaerolineales bacterium]|nr:hypothetical protein [Anaerolineales bacterium]